MTELIDRDLLVEDLIDRIESLEYNQRKLEEFAASPASAGDEGNPDYIVFSGWVVTGTALQDENSYIVLDPTEPMIQVASGGKIKSADYVAGSAGFEIDGGTAEFNDVTVRGTIYATLGEIGGWTIASTYLLSDADLVRIDSSGYISVGSGSNVAIMSGADATYRFWAGHATAASAPFRASQTGEIWATNAHITGEITATSGTLSGLTVTGTLTVGASGTTIDIEGANKRIGTSDFASGSIGWRVDSGGRAEFSDIVARGEIRSAVFTTELISAHAGTLFMSKSAGVVYSDITLSASFFTLYVNSSPSGSYMFETGDIVRIKDGTVDTWVTVTRGSQYGAYDTYVASRQSGTSSGTVKAGTTLVDYGASGQGVLELTADAANSPFYNVATHAGSPWSTITDKVRLGNLAGITDADLSPSGYGLYCDNTFLKGALIAGGGDVILDDTGIEILEGTGNTNYLRWAGAAGGDWVAAAYAQVVSGVPDFTHLHVRSPGNIDGTYSYGFLTLEAYTGSNGLYLKMDPTNSLIELSADVGEINLELAATSGDSTLQFSITGDDYIMGIDNSDSDRFKIGTGHQLGSGTTYMTFGANGSVGIGSVNTGYRLYVYHNSVAYALAVNQDHASGHGLYVDIDGATSGQAALRVQVAAGAYPNLLRANGNGRVGINDASPDATLDVVQIGSTTAIPVLRLDQLDLNQPFIYFANGFKYTGRTAVNEYVKVSWQGTTRYLRLYS